VTLPALPSRRGIRSFVRRAGRVTRAQRRALETLWPRYGINLACAPGDFFGRPGPLMLEVGFGMGDALVAMAESHPERNYLGVDVYPPGIGSALLKIDARGLGNVRLLRADATDLLVTLGNASLQGVLVFFPDPWPKKRHHKRRLVQAPFVELVSEKLQSGGKFELATDWEPYATEMLSLIDGHRRFINLSGKGQFALRPGDRPESKFQCRGERLGHAIFDLIFERRGASPSESRR
jgi:tRNA (guanine-N7-)-methyltransferase